jgi:hypothetical protein
VVGSFWICQLCKSSGFSQCYISSPSFAYSVSKEHEILTFFPLQDTEGLFIKSNFEYVRHNERKAVKILNSASKDNQVLKTGESVSAMYYNNLGCLHFQMQKFNLASFYFCRAIAENEKALALIASVDKSEYTTKTPFTRYRQSLKTERNSYV